MTGRSAKLYLITVFASVLFVLMVAASIKDEKDRSRCKSSGGQVLMGGYMKRGWVCIKGK